MAISGGPYSSAGVRHTEGALGAAVEGSLMARCRVEHLVEELDPAAEPPR